MVLNSDIKNLKIETEYTNQEIVEIFKCSKQGGMRRSKRTNTLTLISDLTKEPYTDWWEGDVLHYTGMGLKGDQSLDYKQNKTLNESDVNGVELHFFEVEKSRIYKYKGIVKKAGEPYQGEQEDKNGENRKVWIFPLKLDS